jgi:hypothetical protein
MFLLIIVAVLFLVTIAYVTWEYRQVLAAGENCLNVAVENCTLGNLAECAAGRWVCRFVPMRSRSRLDNFVSPVFQRRRDDRMEETRVIEALP